MSRENKGKSEPASKGPPRPPASAPVRLPLPGHGGKAGVNPVPDHNLLPVEPPPTPPPPPSGNDGGAESNPSD